MSDLEFPALVSEEQAWASVKAKAAGFEPENAALIYHPFAGFVHGMRLPRSKEESQVHTLVDRLTGKTFITDPWPKMRQASQKHAQVQDPRWNSVNFEDARLRSRRLVSTASLRKMKLGHNSKIREIVSYERIWKPNWLLSGRLGSQKIQVLVDGMNGGYYVVGC